MWCRIVRVGIYDHESKHKSCYVHVLMMNAFNPKPEDSVEKLTVDHIDRNKQNNFIVNLRWATNSEQCINRRQISQKGKIVIQYNESGEEIMRYGSAKSAFIQTGVSTKNISRSCLNNKYKGGSYYWKYLININEPEEIWHPVPKHYIRGVEGVIVSSTGKVQLQTGYRTYGSLDTKGYMVATITDKDSRHGYFVHRLVACSFYNTDDFDNMAVNHKDGNKNNNNAQNLEIISSAENIRHAHTTGLIDKTKCYKSVFCVHKKENIILKYYKSIKYAAQAVLTTDSCIINVCKKKPSRKTSAGYRWFYTGDSELLLMENYQDFVCDHEQSKYICDDYAIFCMNKTSGIISCMYDNIIELGGVYTERQVQDIRKICMGFLQNSSDYIWMFYHDPNVKDVVDNKITLKTRNVVPNKHKSIVKLDSDGNKLESFSNALLAAKSMGTDARACSIIRVCKGITKSRMAYGFGWVYET